MFDQERELLVEAIELAIKREKAVALEQKGKIRSYSTQELIEKTIAEIKDELSETPKSEATICKNKLRAVFEDMDYELVRILVFVMDFARTTNYSLESMSGKDIEAIYKDKHEYFSRAGEPKTILINRMIEKIPLGTYLQKSFEIFENI